MLMYYVDYTVSKLLIFFLDLNQKNRSMVTGLIWPNIAIGVNVIFQEMLALRRARHIRVATLGSR